MVSHQYGCVCVCKKVDLSPYMFLQLLTGSLGSYHEVLFWSGGGKGYVFLLAKSTSFSILEDCNCWCLFWTTLQVKDTHILKGLYKPMWVL